MAPKKAGAKTAPPTKKAGVKAGAPQTVEAPQKASVFDKLEKSRVSDAVQKSSEASRSLNRRVCDRLGYHYPMAAPTMLYVRVSPLTGLTLYDRVSRDVARLDNKSPDAVPMGKTYWAERTLEYEDEKDTIEYEKIVIEDENAPEDPLLKNALVQFAKNNSKTEALIEWSEVVQDVNQKNFAVLMKVLWRVYPGQCIGLARLSCAVLQTIARLKLHTRYTATFALMRGHFDIALSRLLSSFATVHNGMSLWWAEVKHYSEPVLDNQKIEILFAAEDDFSGCVSELRSVAASSRTGAALTAKAMSKYHQDEVTVLAQQAIVELHGKDLTQELVSKAKSDYLATLAQRGISTTTLLQLVTEVIYRGQKVEAVPASTPLDLFNAHVEAFIRSQGVNMGKLDAMWCENNLVSDKQVLVKSIHDSLLAKSKVARQIASGFAIDDDQHGIAGCLEKKGKFILGKDPKFKIEMCFWQQHLGEGGAPKYQQAILQCFAGGSSGATIQEAKEALGRLEKSSFMKICGDSNVAVWTICNKYCDVLLTGGIPDWKELGIGSFAVKLKAAFLNTISTKSGEAHVRGKAALKIELDNLEAAMSEDDKPLYKDTIILRQFMNFLDKADFDKAKQLTNELIQTVSSASASSSSGAGVAVGKEKKASKRCKKDSSLEAINALFTNAKSAKAARIQAP